MCQTLDMVTVVITLTSIYIEVQHYLESSLSKESKEYKISMLTKHSYYPKGGGSEALGRSHLPRSQGR